MTSRLIVKNLPRLTTEDKLRDAFSQKGNVTDIQLKYTLDGRFRHFGFVGFKTSEEAAEACSYFNNTYFGASKISVQPCVTLGDTAKPKAWSKYAPEKSQAAANERKRKVASKDNENDDNDGAKKKKTEEIILEKCQEDPELVEFLEAHRKKSSWGNDTIIAELEKQTSSKSTNNKDKKPKELSAEEDTSESDTDLEKDVKIKVDDKKDKRVKKEKSKPSLDKEFFTIKVRNLPKKARKKELKTFFDPLKPKSIRIPMNMRGFAYISFLTEDERKKALKKNKEFILGQKVFLTTSETSNKSEDASKEKKLRWEEQRKELDKETEPVYESGRIFLRNLSYMINEDDIRGLFEKFGPITEVHLPIDRLSRKLKGFGFVSYLLPEHAVLAFNELDGTIFQGRMLHLLPSKQKNENEDDSKEGSSYKKKREDKLKKSAGSSYNWNSLFLGANAVTEVATQKYGVTKEEFLLDKNEERSPQQTSIGVRMALAETEIVQDTKQFLEENGVCLESFSDRKTERSRNIFLAKNLPANTTAQELHQLFSKHGELARIILPPSGVTAIIEFIEPAEARASFKKLAYTKFKQLPLFLEWAPINTFKNYNPTSKENETTTTTTSISQADNNDNDKKAIEETTNDHVDEDLANTIPELDTTLFVKNVNFATLESHLKKHFEAIGPVYSATIARKKDSKDNSNGFSLSMGYGFVQFYKSKDATESLKILQGSILQDHVLELKRSNRTLQSETRQKAEGEQSNNKKPGNKLLVRNVPFEASKDELTSLFKTFGELKAVRMPMKLDGSGQHRGFGFIDYYNKQDAKRAYDTMSKSTHLYGRRLNLEWASSDDNVDELRVKTARKFDILNAVDRDKDNSTKRSIKRYFETLPQKKRNDSDDDNDD